MSKYTSIIEALLTPPQKLWLEAILNKQNNGQEVNERVLKVELRNELPRGFDPSEIHSLLLRGKTNITLLGIGLVDPEKQNYKNDRRGFTRCSRNFHNITNHTNNIGTTSF